MKNNNKTFVILVALLVAVVGLSIAYATLSTTLGITFGTVTSTAQTWDIHFKDETVAPSINTGTDRSSGNGNESGFRECGNVTSAGTSITMPNIKLSKPGDKCVWKITIQNGGSIKAKLNSITKTNPTGTNVTCSGDYNNLTCGNIIYRLNTDTNCGTSNLFSSGGTINASTGTQTVYICATFNSGATSIPTSNVVQTGMKYEFNYIQQ